MTRADAWVMFAAAAVTSNQENLDPAEAADAMLEEFDKRFKMQGGDPRVFLAEEKKAAPASAAPPAAVPAAAPAAPPAQAGAAVTTSAPPKK